MDVIGIGAGGIVFGIISSLLASFIAWKLGVWYQQTRLRKKYEPIEGTYDGYVFSATDGRVLEPDPISKAQVAYDHDNVLSIEVGHEERRWRGTIFMETGHSGTIVWKYIDTPGELEFGFKRCIFESAEMYLVGEKDYGKEVFKKRAKAQR